MNKKNRKVGVMEKLQAHREGRLHRALSVMIFNSKGEVLLQQRAAHKYHSPGLWANAACSHPRPGERTLHAARRRLQEEMGIPAMQSKNGHMQSKNGQGFHLTKAFSFIYRAQLPAGGKQAMLIEHEYDTVFTGVFDGVPKPDAREVMNWQWVPLAQLPIELAKNPQKYAVWFHDIMQRYTH